MEEIKKHAYKVGPGLVYPTLRSLEKQGLLKSDRKVVDGKMRIYYEMTEKGLEMLEKSKEKIRELVDEVLK